MTGERILIFGDSFQNPTGFGVNSKRICWALAKKYDVHHIGIQYYDKKKPVEIDIEGEKRTVTIHPNLPKANVPTHIPDVGYRSIPHLLNVLEPEVFLSINDIHMCSHVTQHLYPQSIKLQVMNLPAKEMKSDFEIRQQLNGLLQKYKEKYPRKTKFLMYAPQDSLPPMKKWEYTYKIADKVIAYTKFGQKVFKDYFNMDVPYIYHGIDSKVFKPIDTRPDNVKDKFIVGDMNRNQIRKQPIQLIKGFAKFAKGKDDVLLHLQKDWNDEPGYNLEYFVKAYGIQDKLIKPFPRGVNRLIIRNIYNTWDVNMNATSGEGFGITQIEAGACGKPSISTDYTAMTEIIKGGKYSPRGQLVDKTLYWRQLHNAAGQQAIPNYNQIAKALQKYYDNRKLMKRHGNNMRKWVNEYCTMKKLQHDWTKAVDELLSE